MAISYRNMQAFLRVAESATFAEAAEKLHLTQPALSSAIKKMEEQLGGKLFSRSTRRVQLTPEGQTLLPSARRLIDEWDETFDEMQNLFAVRQGKLTVAAMPSFAEARLPALLTHFHNDYPNIRLRILDIVMEATINSVLGGQAEMGFTFEPHNTDGLIFTPLFNDAFIGVLYPEHPLASAKWISARQLLQHPFVAMNRGSSIRRWTDELAVNYEAPVIVAEAGQLGTVGQLIAKGLGVSIVPQLCQAQMQRNGLVCLPLADQPLIRQVGMIRASRNSMSVAAQALWAQCLRMFTSAG